MAHKFNPANIHKLDNPKRREVLPPEKTLISLGLKTGMKVADIGCGSGYFALAAASIVGDEGIVYGTDILQEMVEYCTKAAQDNNITNTLFLKGEESGIPLPDGKVDIVIMANVVHELIEPEKSFREVKRILKPGGKLFLIEWKKIETPTGPPVHERIDIVDAEKMLKEYGFIPEKQHDLGEAHYAIVAIA